MKFRHYKAVVTVKKRKKKKVSKAQRDLEARIKSRGSVRSRLNKPDCGTWIIPKTNENNNNRTTNIQS